MSYLVYSSSSLNVIPSQAEAVASFQKNFIYKRWETPCKNLHVSVARILIFLWGILTELSFSSNFWKDDNLSLYVTFNVLACSFNVKASDMEHPN